MRWFAVLKQAIRFVLALVLCGYFYLHYSQGYWVVISAVSGLSVARYFLWQRKMVVLAVTGLVAAILVGVSSTLSSVVFAFFLFFVTFFSLYLGFVHRALWGCAWWVNFLAILSGCLAVSGGMEGPLCVLLGFLIAMMVQTVVFPGSAVKSAKLALADCLHALAQLTTTIFDCYIVRDYQSKHFEYEKKFHRARSEYLRSVGLARAYIAEIKLSQRAGYLESLHSVEQLSEWILALSGLIYRVNDHSTFEVACKEFSALSESIVSNLQRMILVIGGNKVVGYESLAESIDALEDVNKSALQVVAREPVVYWLFIQDLIALDGCFERFFGGSVKGATG